MSSPSGRRSMAGASRSRDPLTGPLRRDASAIRIAASTAATVCSNVFPSVWTWSASSAGRSGATGRLRSRSSRRRRSARIALASGELRREAALLGAPPGPLLGGGVEEDLQVGVGQDDRPDVAAGHYDPAAISQRPLAGEQRRTNLGHARQLADRSIDLGTTHLLGHVDAVDEDPRQPTALVRRQLDLVDERHEREPGRRGRRRGAARCRSGPGRAARCRRTGNRARGQRPRRRCSCRTRPARRARRRAGGRSSRGGTGSGRAGIVPGHRVEDTRPGPERPDLGRAQRPYRA